MWDVFFLYPAPSFSPFSFPLPLSFAGRLKVYLWKSSFFPQSFCLIAAVLKWPVIMVPCYCLAVEILHVLISPQRPVIYSWKPLTLFILHNYNLTWIGGCILRVRFYSMISIPSYQAFTFLEIFSLFSWTGSDLRILLSVAVVMLSW